MLKILASILFLVSNMLNAKSPTAVRADIVNLKSPKGISIKLVQVPGANSISMNMITLHAGSAYQPHGMTDLLSECFEKSESEPIDGKDMGSIIKENNLQFDVEFSQDKCSISFTFLKGQEDILVPFARGRLFGIKFEEFNDIRSSTASDIKTKNLSPQGILVKNMKRLAFGTHPYGFSTTEKNVNAISLPELRQAYNGLFNKSNLTVIIAGNINKDEAMSLVDRIWDGISDKPLLPVKQIPNVVAKKLGADKFIKNTRSTNKQVACYINYNRGTSPTKSQIAHELLLEYMLRGTLYAGLLHELRDSGLTYRLSSKILNLDHTHALILQTQTDKYQQLRAKTISFMKRLAQKGVSKQEFDDALSFLKSSYKTVMVTPSDYVSIVVSSIKLGLNGEIARIFDCLSHVNLKSFNAFLKTHIKPQDLSFVIVD